MHASTYVLKYVSSEEQSGFLDDVSIIFIDKTDPKDPNTWGH